MPTKLLRDDQELYEVLRGAVKRGDMPPDGLRKIERAYRQARRAHYYQLRKSGEPYIYHPIAVVHRLVLELGVLDVTTIVVGYLHDAVEDQLRRVLPLYGQSPRMAVWLFLRRKYGSYGLEVVKNLRIITRATWQEDKAEYLRDMSKRSDWPALIVKLADRDHNVETLGARKPDSQLREAWMTLDEFPAILAAYLVRCPEAHLSNGAARQVMAMWTWRIVPRCKEIILRLEGGGA